MLIQRQTTDWGKLEDEHMRVSASHLLVMGTVTPACAWKSNVTLSREESQEIDHVLEIYHHCFFFFNKVGEVKGFVVLCFELVYSVSMIIVHSLWLETHPNP